MKNILKVLAVLLITSCLFGCNNKKPHKSEVKLLGIDTSVSEEKMSYRGLKKAQSEEQVATTNLDYQYLLLYKNEYEFDMTINLDNPKDYHIFDFTLSCDDENAEIMIDKTYTKLSDLKSINWKGDTNSKYTIEIKLSNDKFLNTLKLTSIYYSDREDLSNKYDVDLNQKENVYIYKVNKGLDYQVTKIADNHIYYKLIPTELEHGDYSTLDLEQEYYGEQEFAYKYLLNEIKYTATQTISATLDDIACVKFDEAKNKYYIELSELFNEAETLEITYKIEPSTNPEANGVLEKVGDKYRCYLEIDNSDIWLLSYEIKSNLINIKNI